MARKTILFHGCLPAQATRKAGWLAKPRFPSAALRSPVWAAPCFRARIDPSNACQVFAQRQKDGHAHTIQHQQQDRAFLATGASADSKIDSTPTTVLPLPVALWFSAGSPVHKQMTELAVEGFAQLHDPLDQSRHTLRDDRVLIALDEDLTGSVEP